MLGMNTRTPICAALLGVLLSGCAYWQDRGRDFTDIVTLAAESGTVNVSLQAGMLFGLGMGRGQGVGLRAGYAGLYDYEEENILTLSRRRFTPRADDRSKAFRVEQKWLPVPGYDPGGPKLPIEYVHFWQIECAVGLLGGVRVGVNLAELADFLVGFTTVDICRDDVSEIELIRGQTP
jgi:hypothetical protein